MRVKHLASLAAVAVVMALVHSHAHGANPPGSWHEFCGQRHGPGVRRRASVRAGTGRGGSYDSMGDTEKQSGTQGARWCDRAAAIMGSISLLILFAFRATIDACLRGATLVYGWVLSLLERTLKMRWSKDTKRSFVVYLLLFQSVESVVADVAAAAARGASPAHSTPPTAETQEDGTKLWGEYSAVTLSIALSFYHSSIL